MPTKTRLCTALYCDDASLTQQHFKEECDINVILQRAAQTGELPLPAKKGVYGDFSNIPSYQDAFNIVMNAQKLFMELPWELRERFGNNPEQMVLFLNNPQNRDEAIKLGLVKAPESKPEASITKTSSDATPPKPKASEGVA